MLYAKVVIGLPIEGLFDYFLPPELRRKINLGARVKVSFGPRRILGFVVGLSRQTLIKNVKPVLEVIDDIPLLDKEMLLLTRKISDYYCCSWGEAIEAALPEALRKGRPLPKVIPDRQGTSRDSPLIRERNESGGDSPLLIHELEPQGRWPLYLDATEEVLSKGKSVIVLCSDTASLFMAKEKINARITAQTAVLYRKDPHELEEWARIKSGKVNIVIGTRSSVFAPLPNLGLIIVDDEDNPVYKQEQSPHYNARVAAFMRADIAKARLILASAHPSLEMLHLARRRKIKYTLIERRNKSPEIKIINPALGLVRGGKGQGLSRLSIDTISSFLAQNKKILLFLNRSGFATFSFCHNCKASLKCPRCNVNLVYYQEERKLSCHYCNFKMPPPDICPNCQAGYIKYSGTGIEKIESELYRVFPKAKVMLWGKGKGSFADSDIVVSTQRIIKEEALNFSLIVTIAIDNSLNLIDFRAAEKAFSNLVGLLGKTQDTFIIQTHLAGHHAFRALQKNDVNIFYDEELKQRKQLNFPPFKHLGLVRLRGNSDTKVKNLAESLFKQLSQDKPKGIEVISVNPAQAAKKRGNFWWEILLRSNRAENLSVFLRKRLKKFSRSGIIVTIDIDPL
ncbi:MAG: primosomal protein N' [Candidatus Omnitrophota bacterium]